MRQAPPTPAQLHYLREVALSVGYGPMALDRWVRRFGVESVDAIPYRATARRVIGALLAMQSRRDPARHLDRLGAR